MLTLDKMKLVIIVKFFRYRNIRFFGDINCEFYFACNQLSNLIVGIEQF